MKVAVGDVMNSKSDIRDYLSVHPENGRIYVDGASMDVVLIDKSKEWNDLKDRVQELEDENSHLIKVGDIKINRLQEENERLTSALESILTEGEFEDVNQQLERITETASKALEQSK